ncbi:PH domain-containing protein [Actinoallomurus purpureus]|uniref:PH domain-containing protein n=1 Tax=Actinoallomurus purpureus TaxID=478114 RepID=UPI002093A9DB|nr:PH domain-containing protein [Actinoallomurus purpureus]MCO6005772.1 PH domain-containing protein [Actinoallomurus purpureus]
MTTATWRPRRARIVPYVLATVVVLGMIVLAVVMPAPWGLGDRLGLVAIGLIVAGILHMLARSRVTADPEGVTIVNGLRTHEYDWAELIGVSMAEGAPWPTLDLADGSTVAIMGIQASDGDRASRALGELAALIHERGEAKDH